MSKLIIVGNGFDLHHGMKTTFSDFIKSKEGEPDGMYPSINEFKKEIEKGFMRTGESRVRDFNNDKDWNQIEEYLKYAYVQKVSFDHELEIEKTNYDYDKGFNNFIYFRRLFKEYLIKEESILEENKINSKLKKELNEADQIITYNYTTLIENLYKIGENKIIHINGKLDENANIIIGYENHEVTPENVQESNIFDIDRSFTKTELRNYIQNPFTYSDLSNNCEELIIMGHSLGKSDNDDWKILKNKIKDTTKIKVYIYEDALMHKKYFKNRFKEAGILNEIAFEKYEDGESQEMKVERDSLSL